MRCRCVATRCCAPRLRLALADATRSLRVCGALLVRRFSFTMPYPLGSFGEGFVKDLTAQPVWDLSAPTPFVLYKGARVPYMQVDG